MGPGDTVKIVDDTYATRTQIIYPHTDGTYRCAWVDADALIHKHSPGLAATCTTPQVCTTCDAILNDVTSHTPGPAATCTTTQTCTVCGLIMAYPIDHTYNAGEYIAPSHPHTIYNTCICSAKQDSGQTTTISSCEICNPPVTYEISFVTNGGSPTILPHYKMQGETITLSSLTKNGHSFLGWDTDSSSDTAVYKAGTVYTVTGDATLYAVWKQDMVNVTGISLNKTSMTVDVGNTLTLTATVTPSNATNKSVTWTSTNPSVATVTNGVVNTLKVGTTTITATTVDGSKTATCVVIVSAPEEPTNPDAAAIVVNDITTRAGETFDVTVNITNNPGICFLQITLEYDKSVLTLKGATNGPVLSTFENGVNLQWSADADTSKNDSLVTLTFEVNENAKAGEYAVNTIFREAYDSDLNDVLFTVSAGMITVADFIYGDANGDGVVNGRDAVLLRKYMVNYNYDTGTSSVAVSSGADANGDGKPDGKDVVLLRKYMANYNYDTGTSSVVLGPQH